MHLRRAETGTRTDVPLACLPVDIYFPCWTGVAVPRVNSLGGIAVLSFFFRAQLFLTDCSQGAPDIVPVAVRLHQVPNSVVSVKLLLSSSFPTFVSSFLGSLPLCPPHPSTCCSASLARSPLPYSVFSIFPVVALRAERWSPWGRSGPRRLDNHLAWVHRLVLFHTQKCLLHIHSVLPVLILPTVQESGLPAPGLHACTGSEEPCLSAICLPRAKKHP